MLHFRTTTVFSYPVIRTVVHSGPARCKLHAEGASTQCSMSQIAQIAFQIDEFGIFGNFDPPPFDGCPTCWRGQALFCRPSCLLVRYKSYRSIVTTPSLLNPPHPCHKTNKRLGPRSIS